MDWNNDGKKDLIAGDYTGGVTLFLNVGTDGEPELAKGKKIEAEGKPITGEHVTLKKVNGRYVRDRTIPASHKLAERFSTIHMADWDGDGLRDLLIGHARSIVLYKNVGTQWAPRFRAPTLIKPPKGGFADRPSPYVIDWDGDGKRDLLVGSAPAKIYFHRNIGSNKKPELARGEALELKGPGSEAGSYWRIDVTDWNNDGKRDLLVGNMYNKRKGPYEGRPVTRGNVWLFFGK